MFCSQCGTKLGDTAKFCKSCGAPVAAAAASPAVAAPPPVSPPRPVTPPRPGSPPAPGAMFCQPWQAADLETHTRALLEARADDPTPGSRRGPRVRSHGLLGPLGTSGNTGNC